MNRKNTILLAVLVNAGLLVVLFITAMTSQEEISIAPTHEVSRPMRELDPAPPLFTEELDLALRIPKSSAPSSEPVALLPEPTRTPESKTEIVHALPLQVEAPAPAVAAAPVESAYAEVAVKKGDTLEKIAKANRTTVDEIIKANRLPSSFLRVGQVLKIPSSQIAKAPKPSAPPAPLQESGPEYYTVKVGDNPWTIAMKHHLKVDELLKLNALNEDKARKLKPGDRLRIR